MPGHDMKNNHGLQVTSLMGALQQRGAKSFGHVTEPDLIQRNVKKSGTGKAGVKAKTNVGKDTDTKVQFKAKGSGQARIKKG